MTEVLTIPALLLEMVDKQDPVQVGANEVYTIIVLNQGEAEDRDVKVVCRLPEGLSYVDSSGPTKATADGPTVTFGPIDRLGPKEKATWTVTAKATKAGDVRTKVDLTSEYLRTPVTETEPTPGRVKELPSPPIRRGVVTDPRRFDRFLSHTCSQGGPDKLLFPQQKFTRASRFLLGNKGSIDGLASTRATSLRRPSARVLENQEVQASKNNRCCRISDPDRFHTGSSPEGPRGRWTGRCESPCPRSGRV